MVIELLILFYLFILGIVYYILTRNDTKLALFFVKIIAVIVIFEVLYIGYHYFIKGNSICHMMKSIACRK